MLSESEPESQPITGSPSLRLSRGSRLGSLYYSITNLTRDLPAALACDVIEGHGPSRCVFLLPVRCCFCCLLLQYLTQSGARASGPGERESERVWCVMWA